MHYINFRGAGPALGVPLSLGPKLIHLSWDPYNTHSALYRHNFIPLIQLIKTDLSCTVSLSLILLGRIH